MPTFDGKRVSGPWRRVLTQARGAGVRFTLNSGRRTMAEQWALYRNPPRFPDGTPVPVAFPNPLAPHIRAGFPAHALDINAVDGGETRLEEWLERHGVAVSNPVASEPWHLTVPDAQLVALSNKIKRRKDTRRRRAINADRRKTIARKHGADFVAAIWHQAHKHDLPFALGLLGRGPRTERRHRRAPLQDRHRRPVQGVPAPQGREGHRRDARCRPRPAHVVLAAG
jgi:hypothetical protein